MAPAVGDGIGPGEEDHLLPPLCSESLTALLATPPPIGWAWKRPPGCKKQEVGHPFFSSLSKYFKPSHLTGDTFNCILRATTLF